MVSIGTIVWLSSELMFFAGLFAMYFTIRSVTGADNWPPSNVHLAVGYSAIFTTILIASSFTCQWGVFKAEEGDVYGMRRWFFITLLMGLTFVLGQANEYRNQYHEGMTIHTNGYGSVFYLTCTSSAGCSPSSSCCCGPRWAATRRRRPPAPSWCPTTGTSSTSCGSVSTRPST
jgi:heme/copper-type cytochrome/quinol oxidase subunit 3